MSTAVVIALLVLVAVMVGVLVIGRGSGRPRPARSIDGRAEREAALAAQADVEEHDIDEMLAARDALRRRIGKPSLADELEDDVRRDPSGD